MSHTILFVCKANQFRSQLAAAYFQFKLNQLPHNFNIAADSAGTWAATGIPIALDVRKEIEKLGMTGFLDKKSKQIDENLCNKSRLIIVMEQGQKEALAWEFPSISGRLYLLSELADGINFDIEDPAVQGVSSQMIINELYSLIDKCFMKIIEICRKKEQD